MSLFSEHTPKGKRVAIVVAFALVCLVIGGTGSLLISSALSGSSDANNAGNITAEDNRKSAESTMPEDDLDGAAGEDATQKPENGVASSGEAASASTGGSSSSAASTPSVSSSASAGSSSSGVSGSGAGSASGGGASTSKPSSDNTSSDGLELPPDEL